MALDSTSTYAQAKAQLNNNLVWEGSPTKARDFLEAVRWLWVNRATFSSRQNSQLNWADLRPLESKAAAYVATTDTTASAARTSFARARLR